MIITISFISLVLLAYFILISYLSRPTNIAKLINENKDDISMIYYRNEIPLIEINKFKKMPLASMMKIILAVEYTEQVEAKSIDPNNLVQLKELDKYYIEGTDGGAHTRWCDNLKKKNLIINNCVELKQIVNGMIECSSNANTEFLMDLLTIDSLNRQLKKLELVNHDEFRYIVSSLFINDTSVILDKRKLNIECESIHQKLKEGKIDKNQIKLALTKFSNIEKLWSDNFIQSTADEYFSLLTKIYYGQLNSNIKNIFEWPTKDTLNNNWAKEIGAKGGSTGWILNYSIYVTTKDGDNNRLVFMLNNKQDKPYYPVFKKGFNKFLKLLFTDNKSRNQFIKIINSEKN